MPFRALVIITANNAVLRRDMLRRILPVRIVVETDEPEGRQFDFDPYTEAKRDRLAILAAGFTIVRAWWQVRETEEGRRIRATTLGSFEQWADLVAGAVEWLTGINPITLIEERKAADPKRGDERQVIAALHAYFGEATGRRRKRSASRRSGTTFGNEDRPATGIDPDLVGWRADVQRRAPWPVPGRHMARQAQRHAFPGVHPRRQGRSGRRHALASPCHPLVAGCGEWHPPHDIRQNTGF